MCNCNLYCDCPSRLWHFGFKTSQFQFLSFFQLWLRKCKSSIYIIILNNLWKFQLSIFTSQLQIPAIPPANRVDQIESWVLTHFYQILFIESRVLTHLIRLLFIETWVLICFSLKVGFKYFSFCTCTKWQK